MKTFEKWRMINIVVQINQMGKIKIFNNNYCNLMQEGHLQRIFPEGIPAAVGPYSPVTKVGNMVFISGQLPIHPESGNVEGNDIESQAQQVMKNLKRCLEDSGCSFSSIAKTTILLTDMAFFAKVNEIYGSYFEQGKYPARICYAVAGLPKGSLIEIDCIATTVSSQWLFIQKNCLKCSSFCFLQNRHKTLDLFMSELSGKNIVQNFEAGAGAQQDDLQTQTPNQVKQQDEIEPAQALEGTELFIGNLSFQVCEEDILEKFKECGNIKKVQIATDQKGNKKGFAFVRYGLPEEALTALKVLDKQVLSGRIMRVSLVSKDMKKPAKFTKQQESPKIKLEEPNEKQKVQHSQTLSKTLLVKNLSFQVTQQQLLNLFSAFGVVTRIRLPKLANSQHRGFGFVQFETSQEAILAKQQLSHTLFHGRQLTIVYHMDKQACPQK